MNTQPKTQSEFTPYNSQHFTKQKCKPPQGLLKQILSKGTSFPFSQANDSIAISHIRELTPSKMKDFEVKDPKKPMAWDEKAFHQESFSGWSQLYFIIVGLAKISLILFLPLWYLMIIGGFLYTGDPWVERGWSTMFYGTTLYATVPCLIIYLHFKLVGAGYLFLAPFLKPQLICQLNRQTGMVTSYKKGNKVRFTHPFIEFDCVLLSAPSPQGHLNYKLMLVHRYQDYSSGVLLSGIMGHNQVVAEYKRLWNMIQQFMDNSQPLPDILELEPARSKDPVTVEYDKKTGRNPRYWRDMTDEQFAQALDDLREKQQSQSTTGPVINIFEDEEPTR